MDKAAIEILEDVNEFVVGLLQGDGGGPFGPEVTRRIKLANLRLELLAICKAFHIAERPIADKKSWAAIQEKLLRELCGSPIKATEKMQAALPDVSSSFWQVTRIWSLLIVHSLGKREQPNPIILFNPVWLASGNSG